MKQFEFQVGAGRKLVIDYENGYTIQRVIGAKYTKDKVDIHITYNSTLKGKGFMWKQSLKAILPKHIQRLVIDNGGRILESKIVFGPQYVKTGAVANALSMYMNQMELIAGQSK